MCRVLRYELNYELSFHELVAKLLSSISLQIFFGKANTNSSYDSRLSKKLSSNAFQATLRYELCYELNYGLSFYELGAELLYAKSLWYPIINSWISIIANEKPNHCILEFNSISICDEALREIIASSVTIARIFSKFLCLKDL